MSNAEKGAAASRLVNRAKALVANGQIEGATEKLKQAKALDDRLAWQPEERARDMVNASNH